MIIKLELKLNTCGSYDYRKEYIFINLEIKIIALHLSQMEGGTVERISVLIYSCARQLPIT